MVPEVDETCALIEALEQFHGEWGVANTSRGGFFFHPNE
jgi:hypothetical protein